LSDFDDLFEPHAIEGRASLVDFVDRLAARIVRDCVDDYTQSRLPSGGARPTVAAGLRTGMEAATWDAFPSVLTMLGELIAAALSPLADDRLAQSRGVIGVVTEAFDRRAAPPHRDPLAWSAARDGMVQCLADLGDKPPRPLDAIVAAFAGTVLAVMPIDIDLGPDDYPVLCALLRAKLAAARGEFERDADWPALARALAAPRPGA
jgi:hypothetical protein